MGQYAPQTRFLLSRNKCLERIQHDLKNGKRQKDG